VTRRSKRALGGAQAEPLCLTGAAFGRVGTYLCVRSTNMLDLGLVATPLVTALQLRKVTLVTMWLWPAQPEQKGRSGSCGVQCRQLSCTGVTGSGSTGGHNAPVSYHCKAGARDEGRGDRRGERAGTVRERTRQGRRGASTTCRRCKMGNCLCRSAEGGGVLPCEIARDRRHATGAGAGTRGVAEAAHLRSPAASCKCATRARKKEGAA